MRLLIVVILSWFTISCNTDPSEIGSDFFDDGAMDFSLIDSCTVSLSTITFEKLITSDASRLLVGYANDEKLGSVKASSVFEVTIPTSYNLPENNITYLYSAVVFRYDGYSYYDTTALLTLNVHRLQQSLEYDGGYLYNNSAVNYDVLPLGTVAFKPRPHTDSVEVKLADQFGEDLFNKVQDDDDVITTTDAFLKVYKGFAIVPAASQGALIGLGTAPELRLYYRDNNAVPAVVRYISFARSTGCRYFNQIISDRSTTKLKNLVSTTARLGASQTDDEAYLQGGTALGLRVDIPYLRDLKQIENFFVTQAILEIYPIRNSATEQSPLPASLTVYKADADNEFAEESTATAILLEDTDLGRDSRYYLDITQFVKNQMSLEVFNENALVFVSSDFTASVNRLYVGNAGHDYKTRVRIYYTTINQ